MYCAISSQPIDLADLLRRVRRDADGAIVSFIGVVRDHNEGRGVVRLSYAAYEEMAERKLRSICEEVGEQFDVGGIAAVHRVGELEIGEPSVAICVSAAHRDAAYRASREIIERLKREVPIWKKETYVGGEQEWQQGYKPGVEGG